MVADLGCGNGSMLAQFRDYGWELQGLDMSQSGLTEASKENPHIHFRGADLTTDLSSHPLAGSRDVLISTEVVEHVFLPRIYARNRQALLKPSGFLIISTPYHGYLKNLALGLTGKMDVPLHRAVGLWSYQVLVPMQPR